MSASVLAFQAFETTVETGFWSALGELKLHHLKLEEGPVPVASQYLLNNDPHNPGFLHLEENSLDLEYKETPGGSTGSRSTGLGWRRRILPPPVNRLSVAGDGYCLNTRGQLGTFDRKSAVDKVASEVWSDIVSGAAEQQPALLQRLVLLTYCDLKHYKNSYWLAFPALKPPSPYTLSQPYVPSLSAHFSSCCNQVLAACSEYCEAHPSTPFWLLAVPASPAADSSCPADGPGTLIASGADQGRRGGEQAGEVTALPLTAWQQAKQAGAALSLVMADCSNLPANPGWPLRNALLLAASRWKVASLQVVCLRRRRGRYDPQASIVLQVDLPALPPDFHPTAVSGWQTNRKTGKVEPSIVDLGPTMDPQRQAASAVNLNLSLMRWRASPTLDVSSIGATKCLLLGAGTLGCSVARCLLGWGVRHITFVDNSRVAYSNPVRQSLYNFEDCLHGGVLKAQAAADAVTKVFPGVTSTGVALTIPMPGHPIAPSEILQVLDAVAALEDLIHQHDVVFLLMDTRESRWLPTLLAAAAGKLAINSALGFDGFMVMRHGMASTPMPSSSDRAQQGTAQHEERLAGQEERKGSGGAGPGAGGGGSVEGGTGGEDGAGRSGQGAEPREESEKVPLGWGTQRLGCYFCNDVVAPINSTVDRTMDQQCTVARPGLSLIAGSLAVELMVAALSHPLGARAPPAGSPASRQLADTLEAPLGEVPHMIRGQLGGFSQMCLSGQAFQQCTACSDAVLQRYRDEGHAFILKALQNPKDLEDLTGLTELHRSSQAVVESWDSKGDQGTESGSRGGRSDGGEDAWEEI